MPIKHPELYPKNWKQISKAIRKRANGQCEWCHAPDGLEILRSVIDPIRYIVLDERGEHVFWPSRDPIRLSEIPEEYDAQSKYVRVVLTVAHLDHNPENNDPANLAALCQRCHLVHDAEDNAAKARITRQQNRETEREKHQPRLF